MERRRDLSLEPLQTPGIIQSPKFYKQAGTEVLGEHSVRMALLQGAEPGLVSELEKEFGQFI